MDPNSHKAQAFMYDAAVWAMSRYDGPSMAPLAAANRAPHQKRHPKARKRVTAGAFGGHGRKALKRR